MLRLLLLGSVVIIFLGGLFYFRFIASFDSLKNPNKVEASPIDTQSPAIASEQPHEVPKTLPTTGEDKVKDLQSQVENLTKQINDLKKSNNWEARLTALESGLAEVKVKIVTLEKGTTETSTSTSSTPTSKSPLYIPFGSGGGPWTNEDWHLTPEYQVSINPADYPGYTGMQLELIFRYNQPSGTAYARLINATDNKVISSELSTTSTAYTLQNSASFQLPSGTKTYQLQVKNSASNNSIFIQTARIKVSF